ncbi:chorismate-binding protein [Acinetobacter baumannii]|uniref:chorismate-binding protein n=1 Tax=Acinetobacter baumannii TaxID=470 RepID=UPI00244B7BC8|nr:chorismate-binding protein [Acinetobacter baumannii]MDH2566686.1 chorismate-binding protein [Acinetobacter baumannii]
MKKINLTEELLFKNDKIDPTRIAFFTRKRSLQYDEFKKLIHYNFNKIKNTFLSPGDKVIIMMDETPLFSSLFFAIIAAGAIPVVINPKLNKSDLLYIIKDLNSKLIFTNNYLSYIDFFPGKIFHIDENVDIDIILNKNIPQEPIDFFRSDESSEVIVQYTSGSTGHPKGVLHTANKILKCCDMVSKHLKINKNDILYSTSKTFFGFGMGNTLFFPMYNGASAVLDTRWPDIESITNNLRLFNPTILFAVPTIFEKLIDLDFKSCLRLAQSSGSHLPSNIAKKWKSKFGIELLNGIGSTELLHLFAGNKNDDNKIGSVGKILNECQFKLVDEEDNPVDIGQVGKLIIKSPTLALAYSKNGVVTYFEDEWYATGDLFIMDSENYLYFYGRIDDRFKVNGRWIIPLELENKILAHYKKLHQCFVSCITNELGFDSIVLFIIGTENKYLLEERHEINRLLSKYQHIDHIILLESAPLNSNGKIDRKQFKNIALDILYSKNSKNIYVSDYNLNQDQYNTWGNGEYNLIPVWKRISYINDFSSNLLFEKIKKENNGFLFETYTELEDQYKLKYSVIGIDTDERIEINENTLRYIVSGNIQWEKVTPQPLIELRSLQTQFKVPSFEELPQFCGGYFGYFGFETTRLIEPRLAKTAKKETNLSVPDIIQIIAKEIVVVDHINHQIFCITHANPKEKGSFEHAKQRCNFISNQVVSFCSTQEIQLKTKPAIQNYKLSEFISYSLPRQSFLQHVDKIKEYIKSGDVMQVVLSQRMELPLNCSPLDYYQSLKKIAHTPYTYFIDLGDFQIIGASPEELVKLSNKKITSRPMAGTRKRTGIKDIDHQLEKELLSDEKEKCEHMMLVDLARNDIGRLALPGSVSIEELMKVELYSHVMHIVSTLTAEVPDSVTGLDVLISTFPAGTLSGASKVRALEIIAELEPHPRGIYGGVIGYISWHGNTDLAIAIRTTILKDQKAYIQAGAGIVNDSKPESEWQETMDKSRVLLLAAYDAEHTNKNYGVNLCT